MRDQNMYPTQTNEELYRRQVETLRQFLRTGAITQAQFDKSFGDLTAKMHMPRPSDEKTNEPQTGGF